MPKVIFQLDYKEAPGERVVVAGNAEAAGHWNPKCSSIVLKPGSIPVAKAVAPSAPQPTVLMATIELMQGTRFEFQFVVLTNSTSRMEDKIPDRILTVTHPFIVYKAELNKPGDIYASHDAAMQIPLAPMSSRRSKSASALVVRKGASSYVAEYISNYSSNCNDRNPNVHRHTLAMAAARKKIEQTQASIKNGDASALQLDEALAAASRQEEQVAKKLVTYQQGLEAVVSKISDSMNIHSEKAAQHTAAAQRLENELRQASAATAAAKLRHEQIRRSRTEVAAAEHVNVTAAEDQFFTAEASHAAAQERFRVVQDLSTKLRIHYETREVEVQEAQSVLKFTIASLEATKAEYANMQEEHASAAAELQKAKAALLSHTIESGRRTEKHDAVLYHARWRVKHAVALRDIASREAVKALDPASVNEAYNRAVSNVQSVSKELALLESTFSATKGSDSARAKELNVAVNIAAGKQSDFERTIAMLSVRLAEKERLVRKAEAACSVAISIATTAREEYEKVADRLEGALAQELAKREEEESASRENLALVRATALQKEAPLRHEEEGELHALVHLEGVESRLSEALDAARIVAAASRYIMRLDCDDTESTHVSSDNEGEKASPNNSPSAQPIAHISTESLVRSELAQLEAHMKRRQEKADQVRASVEERKAWWHQQKALLRAELQLATLELGGAADEKLAMQDMLKANLGIEEIVTKSTRVAG